MFFPNVCAVMGNCDFGTQRSSALVCETDGVTILATHGHLSDVKYDYSLETLTSQAIEAGADIALFGHTHRQHLSENRGVTLLNPGTAGRGYYPGYAVLDVKNGSFSAALKTV